jgi:hypothetical protein
LFDPTTKQRLAELVTDALELGSGKYERDVADDLFRAFGVDLAQVETQVRPTEANRKEVLRKAAADALASAAPSAAALMTEVVRCGGRFVGMVEEIYALLADHVATTSGSSEQFVIKRDELDELEITISPAFIENLSQLQRVIRRVTLGRVDQRALDDLLGWDGGEFYGRWPVDDDHGQRLLDAVLHLGWLADAVAGTAAGNVLSEARTAAGRLVETAVGLVEGHMAHLAELEGDEVETALSGLNEWSSRHALDELQRFRRDGVLAASAYKSVVAGLDQDCIVGLAHRSPGEGGLRSIVADAEDHVSGTSVGRLAQFVAMCQMGMHAERSRIHVEELLGGEPSALVDWLAWVRDSCDEASVWLRDKAVIPYGSIDVEDLIERFEEYLNLPLWRRRQLLYEVWILCATMQACRDAGWSSQFRRLDHDSDVWVVSTKPTATPVADLRFTRDTTITLEVWREPRRVTANGEVTPDVTISTPGDHPRDLVVIEAKDRYAMRAGGVGDDRSALGVAMKYRDALQPIATWVCNHCDFREGDADPSTNYGDVWSRVHIAAPFRPGAIPPAFSESIQVSLTPPGFKVTRQNCLLLAVDVTGSMESSLRDVWDTLREVDEDGFLEYRAVLYSDHGAGDPFVIREIGPCGNLATLVQQIGDEPSGGGGDEEEALEDAMRRCRELATSLGPLTVFVLTDAPPHAQVLCPLGIDFGEEVHALLATGSRCLVAADWQRADDTSWDAFTAVPGFERAPLAELVQRLGGHSD